MAHVCFNCHRDRHTAVQDACGRSGNESVSCAKEHYLEIGKNYGWSCACQGDCCFLSSCLVRVTFCVVGTHRYWRVINAGAESLDLFSDRECTKALNSTCLPTVISDMVQLVTPAAVQCARYKGSSEGALLQSSDDRVNWINELTTFGVGTISGSLVSLVSMESE